MAEPKPPKAGASRIRLSSLLTWKTFVPLLPMLVAYYLAVARPVSVSTSGNVVQILDIPITKVLAQNLQLVKYSWEHGVLTHALLEFQNPELSVFARLGYGVDLRNPNPGAKLEPFPDGMLPMCGKGGRYDQWTSVKALRHAASQILTAKPPKGNRWWFYRSDMSDVDRWESGDAAAADAASLGWMALLLERAGAEDPRNPMPVGRNAYGEAADEMVDYLVRGEERSGNVRFVLDGEVNGTLREVGASDGRRWAISHRCEIKELWGDFVFMVPPFLAAHAVARTDERWLFEAVEQILAYRDVLTIGEVGNWTGLWKHIVTQPRMLENGVCCHDEGLWLTSNAWAVAGITRVLAVLDQWQPNTMGRPGGASDAVRQRREKYRDELVGIIDEMLTAIHWTWMQDPEVDLLRNYLRDPSLSEEERKWDFPDPAGTALIASSAYRLAQLGILTDQTLLSWTDELYNGVAKHIRDDGLLTPVPTWSRVPCSEQVSSTSEAQSFVLLMYSARRDCQKLGICAEADDRHSWLARQWPSVFGGR